ncbi:hypothetical protein RX398_05100 [Collinsella aerofaciens]|uniref:hypothetical protein n=1 Tax=Collinsella aerofaciens TaxID=74426 RepID=UPI002914E87D|nr:hypothetical protein [Collinsella aerofaciens]MDU8576758.1 hypothetical protein [Collinsella aerofaciens]
MHDGDVSKLKSAAAWLLERKCPDEYDKADRRGDDGKGEDAPRIVPGVLAQPVQEKLSGFDGKPSQPSVDELARAVIAGRYGVGEARRKALESRYAEVQRRVNQLLP